MAQLLATKNALPCSNGCLLWGNGSTWVLMEWAKIFIQNFFAAKVFVWIIDEEISDRKIHLSPISRVRTFPGTFFHLWVSPDRGRPRVANQKFHVVRTGFEPWTFGMPAERHNHYTAELCYSKQSIQFGSYECPHAPQYSNTKLAHSRTMRQNREMQSKSPITTVGWVCPVRTSYLGLKPSIYSSERIARP